MRVAEVMHRGVITCAPSTTLGEAAGLLIASGVHALIVADDERPLGVLSDADLLAGEWLATDEERLAAMRGLSAAELMSAPPVFIDVDAEVAIAATRMLSDRLSRLVVLDEGRAVGVIAISDLVRALGVRTPARQTVADVMSHAIVACRPDTPVAAVARAMIDRRSRSVVVLERSGTAVGVVSGRALLALYAGSAATTARDLMEPPHTAYPDDALSRAADAMLQHEVHRLIVVRRGGERELPLGIVSTSDVLAEMAAPDSVWR